MQKRLHQQQPWSTHVNTMYHQVDCLWLLIAAKSSWWSLILVDQLVDHGCWFRIEMSNCDEIWMLVTTNDDTCLLGHDGQPMVSNRQHETMFFMLAGKLSDVWHHPSCKISRHEWSQWWYHLRTCSLQLANASKQNAICIITRTFLHCNPGKSMTALADWHWGIWSE